MWSDMELTEINEPMAHPSPVSWPQTKVKYTRESPRAEFQLVLIVLGSLGIPVTQYYLRYLQHLRTQGEPRLIVRQG